jgi:hypothetical protein
MREGERPPWVRATPGLLGSQANKAQPTEVDMTGIQASSKGATEVPRMRSRRRGGGPLQRDRSRARGVQDRHLHTRAYAESNGFLTLLSDGERLTGAYALGPEAGGWLQQATLARQPTGAESP